LDDCEGRLIGSPGRAHRLTGAAFGTAYTVDHPKDEYVTKPPTPRCKFGNGGIHVVRIAAVAPR